MIAPQWAGGPLSCGVAPRAGCHVLSGSVPATTARVTLGGMQLGIDFGTTRTIVACVDRGNYPVVTFVDAAGDVHEHIPSVSALVDGELVHGFDALDAQAAGAPLLRSVKRHLSSPTLTARTTIAVGDRELPLLDVLADFLSHVRTMLLQRSSISSLVADDHFAVAVAVPAHAHGAQRYVTLEAFRRAGFTVRTMLNEPSAAGFEYTHSRGRFVTSRRTRVIVYDLGGGTFDASLVAADGRAHEVLASVGVNRLGGDDFDLVLAECALEAAGHPPLDAAAQDALIAECREAKERLAPQTRRIVLDVGGEPVLLRVEDFYAAAAPLVERSLEVMAPLIGMLEDGTPDLTEIAGIYLVGGGSELPLVPRMLRERFGRRLQRSHHPAASSAIGLAIAVDGGAGYSLTDRLSRGFGVFREGVDGTAVTFDQILSRDQRVSPAQEVVVRRTYRPAHNIGCFRFVEYGTLGEDGSPSGDVAPFGDINFPFDRALRGADLGGIPVERRAGGPLIEERYTIDPHGIVEVRFTDLEDGWSLTRRLKAARSGA